MAVRDKVKKQAEVKDVNAEQQTEVEGEKKKSGSARDAVKKSAEVVKKDAAPKERFLWLKVWMTYLLSMFMKDRGKIPNNIGDRVLVTNNLYITKLYMSSIVQIHELGRFTPITFLGVLNQALRDRGNTAVLDFTCKNSNYKFDPKDSGIRSREEMWNRMLERDTTSHKDRERCERCLYTLQLAKTGKQLKQSRMFLTIRAKDIGTLNSAEKIVFETLADMGSIYMPVTSTIKKQLEYITLIGNRQALDKKENIAVMTTNTVLSQLVPNCGSYNDTEGYYLGQNVLNGSPFWIDFSKITLARNMYIVAPSGVGKTVLAMNMAQSAYENGNACCFMDIKGNEYTNFIKATDGYIVSLRPTSIEYINSWVMRKEDTTQEEAESYFRSRVSFSKQQMIILSGITERSMVLEFEELIDKFHDSLYVKVGAIPSNMNSWGATLDLNPYEIFNMFEKFLTPQLMSQYHINRTVIGTLRMYMSSSGSKSYIFKQEFDYARILNSNTLSFDFGMLGGNSTSDVDLDLFRLKFLYMSKLNGDFVMKKYSTGKRTLAILEESQITTDEIKQMYVLNYTLRRSQNQDTVLIGNSVQALQDSKIAKPLIENTTGLFIGELTRDAREIVIEQFGLQHLRPLLSIPGSKPRYKNCFAFINNMQSRTLYSVIQVQIEKDNDGNFRKYKVNTPVAEHSSMGS